MGAQRVVKPDGFFGHNDIALIKVDRDIPIDRRSVNAICLPQRDFIPTRAEHAMIAGWGATGWGPDSRGKVPRLQTGWVVIPPEAYQTKRGKIAVQHRPPIIGSIGCEVRSINLFRPS